MHFICMARARRDVGVREVCVLVQMNFPSTCCRPPRGIYPYTPSITTFPSFSCSRSTPPTLVFTASCFLHRFHRAAKKRPRPLKTSVIRAEARGVQKPGPRACEGFSPTTPPLLIYLAAYGARRWQVQHLGTALMCCLGAAARPFTRRHRPLIDNR